MKNLNLDKIFKPASIAVIGASEKAGSIGLALVKKLQADQYQGRLFPVNPNHPTIDGLKAFASVADIGQPVDLAVIATPMQTVPAVIRECAAAHVEGAVIISAGGKEIGEKGREIETEIRREAQKGGIRIIGPNCAGIICTGTHLYATFVDEKPLPGKMAFISQSGALMGAILDLSLKERIGFSHFVSIGSMLDVDFGDLIDYLGNDPDVSSIVLYVENITHARHFMSAARAVSRIKPIVVLKSGRSAAGAKAAASHTGAMAGEGAIYDAAFDRAGIVRVDTIQALFDCAELVAKQPLIKGPGLAVVTNAGGPGVMAADAMAAMGLAPVSLSEKTIKALDQILPPFWSHGNPIDILGDATSERFRQAVEICIAAPEINGLVVTYVPQAVSAPADVATALTDLLKDCPVPVFAVWMGGEEAEKGREIFNRAGIPTYETPERAVEAFNLMHAYARNIELLQETPSTFVHAFEFDKKKAAAIIRGATNENSRFLSEMESKDLLAAYGIPVNRTEVAASPEEAVRLADEIGYPVAMKIFSKAITHKTDANGVRLNLKSKEAVQDAFASIMAAAKAYDPAADLTGVTIQSMLKRSDYELILGSKKDPVFGPVILFGMGGIMTEILKDQAIALPPLNRLLARRLIQSTRVHQLLKGYRNRPPADLKRLEAIIIGLSQLVTDFPEIAELDINPLVLKEDRFCAVDARVLVKSSAVQSPLHLVISTYPNQYERKANTRGGLKLFVRPIKPEDKSLLAELFHSLSQKSVFYRFFHMVKNLPHKVLARFTQIDYDRDAVLVALKAENTGEKMIGVCRLTQIPGSRKAELGIVVGDPWQGKGVGATLLENCIPIARKRGIESVWGLVLAENTTMLSLAREQGFTIQKTADADQYEIKISLKDDHMK